MRFQHGDPSPGLEEATRVPGITKNPGSIVESFTFCSNSRLVLLQQGSSFRRRTALMVILAHAIRIEPFHRPVSPHRDDADCRPDSSSLHLGRIPHTGLNRKLAARPKTGFLNPYPRLFCIVLAVSTMPSDDRICHILVVHHFDFTLRFAY